MINPFAMKSIFSYQVTSVLNGDPIGFADLLAQGGFESVGFKVADGPYLYGASITPALIAALRARGISIWGWGFLYGENWKGEAQIAAARVNQLGLDGYAFDIEGQYESTPNAVQNAANILSVFKHDCAREVATAFCSWAYWKNPSTGSEWHPITVLRAFMEVCNVGMPMQYWQGSEPLLAVSYCQKSLAQWRQYTAKPIIPAGRAYNGDGGEVNAESVIAYEAVVRAEGCEGISWWVLDQAQPKYHPDVWAALSAMKKFGDGVITPPPPIEPGDVMKAQTTANLNLRETPAGVFILTMPKGTVVEVVKVVTAHSGSLWAEISSPHVGYCSNDFLKYDETPPVIVGDVTIEQTIEQFVNGEKWIPAQGNPIEFIKA